MRASLIAVTLAVQVCTVAVLLALSGHDTQAYPMEAGYVVKDQSLNLVYYEGTPAQMTFDKMDVPEKRSKVHSDSAVVYKRTKNLRCERREVDSQPAYRCAVDLRKI
jgi:hypothetical protein